MIIIMDRLWQEGEKTGIGAGSVGLGVVGRQNNGHNDNINWRLSVAGVGRLDIGFGDLEWNGNFLF